MQATAFDPLSDAQPGKILHETRNGEMARLGEVPFGLYYGTVDATPLYIMLAGMYFGRPGTSKRSPRSGRISRRLCNGLTHLATRMGTALSNTRGRLKRVSSNQGWKDSYDSIFHADGALARGPMRFVRSKAMYLPQRRMPRNSRIIWASMN